MKILLVEDEQDLSAMLAKGLKKSGYAVDMAYDGEEALYYYRLYEYDLIVLDLNLPILDGLEVLKEIRKKDETIKIIILSARTKISQRVEGLDAGANDYLVKPFDFSELEARIRTLLRIRFSNCSTVLFCGALVINTAAKTIKLCETELSLTKKEYSILEYLFLHKEQVVSNEKIIEHIWDSEADLYQSSLKYHIHSIKKKIKDIDGRQYLKNIRGQGYILTEDYDEDIQ